MEGGDSEVRRPGVECSNVGEADNPSGVSFVG